MVLSTDPAHSLADSLECPLGSDRRRSSDNLWGQELKAQEEMERHWEAVSEWLGRLLSDQGVDAISAEELTVPPGWTSSSASSRSRTTTPRASSTR